MYSTKAMENIGEVKKYRVYRIKDDQFLDSFDLRQDAVYYCKVNQTLPLPDYEWEDEFEIRVQNSAKNDLISPT